jgi:hypothetical protein
MRWFFTFSAGVMLLSAGCASMVSIEAKGTQKTEATIPSQVTYAVLPTVEVEKDPNFSTYAGLVARKMDERGFKESDAKTAKLGVYLGYGVTEPLVNSRPSGAPPPMGNPGGMSAGGSGYGGGGGAYGGAASSSDPTSVKRFASQVVIVVGDLPESRAKGTLVELWRGEAMHRGHNNDLPALAPLLVEASFRHFGESSTAATHTFVEEEIEKLRSAK